MEERYPWRRDIKTGIFWILMLFIGAGSFWIIRFWIISYASADGGFSIFGNYLHYHHDSKWSTWSKDHHRYCDSHPDHFFRISIWMLQMQEEMSGKVHLYWCIIPYLKELLVDSIYRKRAPGGVSIFSIIHHSESFGFFSGEEKKSWGTRHLMIPSMKYLISVQKYDKTGSPPDSEWVGEPDH